eukprot:364214-Chlamydomonas_euryale.AAC.1
MPSRPLWKAPGRCCLSVTGSGQSKVAAAWKVAAALKVLVDAAAAAAVAASAAAPAAAGVSAAAAANAWAAAWHCNRSAGRVAGDSLRAEADLALAAGSRAAGVRRRRHRLRCWRRRHAGLTQRQLSPRRRRPGRACPRGWTAGLRQGPPLLRARSAFCWTPTSASQARPSCRHRPSSRHLLVPTPAQRQARDIRPHHLSPHGHGVRVYHDIRPDHLSQRGHGVRVYQAPPLQMYRDQ